MTYKTVVNGKVLTDEELAERKKKNADRFNQNMGDILRSRRAPQAETDDTYLRGHGTLLQQFDGEEKALEMHLEACKEHGFTPRENDVYMPTLARFKGDPRAHIRSRGEAVRYAEERGVALQINGKEAVKARDPEEDPWEDREVLDERLIRESVPDVLQDDPSLAKDPVQLREAVIEKHAYQ